jgi:hypothetical protein
MHDPTPPPGGSATQEYLIMWLAYTEANAMIKFHEAPPPQGKNDNR